MSERGLKRDFVIPLLIVFVITIMLLGLFVAMNQRTCDLDHENHSENLYLRIEMDKNVYDRGEEVIFSIFLVNEEETDFSYTHSGRSWGLVVFDSKGREVVNSSAGWKDHTGINTLEVPANSEKIIQSSFSWDQTLDPTSSEVDQLVPPDCYLLRFFLTTDREVFGEVKISIE